MRVCLRFLLLAAVVVCVNADAIKWTGIVGDNQWTTQNNWYPNTVPGPNDDVTIEKGAVTVTIPTGVASLKMGDSFSSSANLTLYHAFAVGSGGLQVEGNGNLFADCGLETITGSINVDGTFTFISGSLSGVIAVSKTGRISFPGAGQRNLVGAHLTVDGAFDVQGVVGLNQSSLIDGSGSVTASGEVQFMVFDKSSPKVDFSQANFTLTGTVLRVMTTATFGTFNIVPVGFYSNIELYSNVQFVRSFDVPYGNTVSTLGDANVNVSSITGVGTFQSAGAQTYVSDIQISTVVVSGGVATFVNAKVDGVAFSGGVATVVKGVFMSISVGGGSVNFVNSPYGRYLTLTGGVISGAGWQAWAIYVNATTAVLDGITIGTLYGDSYVNGRTEILLRNGAAIVIGNSSTLNLNPGANLNITSGDANNYLNVTGKLSTGTNTLKINTATLVGEGSITVSGGAVNVGAGKVTFNSFSLSNGGTFRGANTVAKVTQVKGPGSVSATLGSYNFQCPTECDNFLVTDTANTFSFSA